MNEKVFRDPVHNYIPVDNPIIYDLINTKEFQRLRRIKQLGSSSFTFHGAEHSRFSHCLGVYHLARRVIGIFEKKYPDIWNPEESLLRIGAVPLFSGFMYAAVGSYIARVQRIFHIRVRGYPPLWTTWVLAAAIYVNFFAHHWLPDVRIALFAATVLLFGRGWFYFTADRRRRSMPLLLGYFLVALFIWFAENLGTFARAWVYPGQADGWEMVSLNKLGAWFLLMIISVVLVSLVHRPEEEPRAAA